MEDWFVRVLDLQVTQDSPLHPMMTQVMDFLDTYARQHHLDHHPTSFLHGLRLS